MGCFVKNPHGHLLDFYSTIFSGISWGFKVNEASCKYHVWTNSSSPSTFMYSPQTCPYQHTKSPFYFNLNAMCLQILSNKKILKIFLFSSYKQPCPPRQRKLSVVTFDVQTIRTSDFWKPQNRDPGVYTCDPQPSPQIPMQAREPQRASVNKSFH